MNELINSEQTNSLECPLRKQWVSFRLVDEFSETSSYAGLEYNLRDCQNQSYQGLLDNDGFALIEGVYCGPMLLTLSSITKTYPDPWYEQLSIRENYPLPLTNLQIAAEQSPIGPRRNGESLTYLAEERAAREGARFFRIEVSDLVEATKHLPDPDQAWGPRPSAGLKQAAGAAADQPGIALEPNQHHVFEVKALRAYSPIFSLSPEFSALNAYQLAVMSTFAYAPFNTHEQNSSPPPYMQPGSIGNVLREQLARQVKPTLFNTAHYHLLLEEVPYSKRLEVVPYDPDRYPKQALGKTPEDEHFLNNKETETQAFITHNDRVILISIRGTASLRDLARDLNANQVPIEDGFGKAHKGFYEAFAEAQKFVTEYMGSFFNGDQTIIVCGHSLGGSIALLLADHLRKTWSDNTQLYTYGAPRTGDSTFVASAKDLVHHRLINNNDPIPAIPTTWMNTDWRLIFPATAMLLASLAPPVQGISLLLAGLLNIQDDPYQHHGEQYYFMPRRTGGGSEASILWQPGSQALEEGDSARFIANLSIEGDSVKRRGFLAHALALKQHSSDAGYSRAALTTLLRWNDSLHRNGHLFTEDETQHLRPQMTKLERELANWVPGSYEEFRRQIRLRHDSRFYNKTDIELLTFYDEGINSATGLRMVQLRELTAAQQRLTAQARIPITAAAVFGDQANREDLQQLVSEWRQEELNLEAERLANVESASAPYGQYA